MTPEQALSILDQATAQIPVNRQTQLQIMEAIRMLSNYITLKQIEARSPEQALPAVEKKEK